MCVSYLSASVGQESGYSLTEPSAQGLRGYSLGAGQAATLSGAQGRLLSSRGGGQNSILCSCRWVKGSHLSCADQPEVTRDSKGPPPLLAPWPFHTMEAPFLKARVRIC